MTVHVTGRMLFGVVLRYGEVAPGFREFFDPGAFGADVGSLDVLLHLQHDLNRAIARTGGGGLQLYEREGALRFSARLPTTRDADDALTLVRTGVIRGASVEFRPLRVLPAWRNGTLHVRIVRALLKAVGLVSRPAYPGSTLEPARTAAALGSWRSGPWS